MEEVAFLPGMAELRWQDPMSSKGARALPLNQSTYVGCICPHVSPVPSHPRVSESRPSACCPLAVPLVNLHLRSPAAVLKTPPAHLLSTRPSSSGLCLPFPRGPGHRPPAPSPKGLKYTSALGPRSNPFSISPKPDRHPKPTPPSKNLSWSHCLARVNLTRCRITITDLNNPPPQHPIF